MASKIVNLSASIAFLVIIAIAVLLLAVNHGTGAIPSLIPDINNSLSKGGGEVLSRVIEKR